MRRRTAMNRKRESWIGAPKRYGLHHFFLFEKKRGKRGFRVPSALIYLGVYNTKSEGSADYRWPLKEYESMPVAMSILSAPLQL